MTGGNLSSKIKTRMILANRKALFCVFLLVLPLLAGIAFLSCQAPKEEAEYASRQPIPTSAGLDVAITITEERYPAPPSKVVEGAALPQSVKSWNTPEMMKYLIGPTDQLHIILYYGTEASTTDVEVQISGKINLPLVGEIEVKDKTAEEVQADILEKVKTYYVNPVVTVIITKYNYHRVYIMGWGITNQEIALKKRTTLIELLSQIGSITSGTTGTSMTDVDIRGAYLQRGQKIYPVDLKKLLEGDLSFNYELNDNDILHLRSKSNQKIFVLGEILRPGSLQLETDDNLFWAIARAGGPSLRAQLHDVRIIRGGMTNPTLITVDIDVMFRRRAPRMLTTEDMQSLRVSANSSRHSVMALETLYLQDEDFIFVPRTAFAAWTDIINMVSPTISYLFTTPVFIATNSVLLKNSLK